MVSSLGHFVTFVKTKPYSNFIYFNYFYIIFNDGKGLEVALKKASWNKLCSLKKMF